MRSDLPRLAAWLLVGLFLFALAACSSGCAAVRRATAPRAAASAGPVAVSQSGDAATPAAAAHRETRWDTWIPAGVEVTHWADGRLTWTPAAPVPVAASLAESTATGPVAFEPPAPPSPADLARGFGVRAFWLAGLGCALVAGLCLWRGYPLAALCAAGAAAALPILANVVSSPAATHAGAVLLALGAGLVIAYKLTRPAAPTPFRRADSLPPAAVPE